MNIDHAAPDHWGDYFEPGGESTSAGVEPATECSLAAERQPVVGQVKLCLDDGTYLVRLPDGTEVLGDNDVFPSLRPEYPVVLYPDGEAGWSLSNPLWRLTPPPLTLRFIRKASGLDRMALSCQGVRASWSTAARIIFV